MDKFMNIAWCVGSVIFFGIVLFAFGWTVLQEIGIIEL